MLLQYTKMIIKSECQQPSNNCLPRQFSKINRLLSSPSHRGRGEIDDKQKHCVPSLDWLESSFKTPQEIRNIYWLKKIELKRLFNFANAILDLHVTFLKRLWVVILGT